MDLTTIDTSGAKLPSTYHAAKRAISQCVSLDECKDWSDKAAALASYAKQAQDEQLEQMAKRIRARATRRAGELLKQVEPASGARSDLGPVPSRGSAAAAAGLSERQAKTAQRLANVPADDFEEMVESGATITAIAAAGTQATAPNRDEARQLVQTIKHYADRLGQIDMSAAIPALSATQRAELRMLIARLDSEHDRVVTSI
jgi:hypothetical protein